MRELAAALLAPVLALAILVVMLPAPRSHDSPRGAGPTPTRRVAIGPGAMSVLVLPGPTLWLVPIVATAEAIENASCDAGGRPPPVHARAAG